MAFGAGGVLNLAHGTLIAAGGYIAATITTGTWGSLAAAIALASLAGAAGGGVLAAATAGLRGRGHLDQALLTFGVAFIGGDVLTTVFGSDMLRPRMPDALEGTVMVAGTGIRSTGSPCSPSPCWSSPPAMWCCTAPARAADPGHCR